MSSSHNTRAQRKQTRSLAQLQAQNLHKAQRCTENSGLCPFAFLPAFIWTCLCTSCRKASIQFLMHVLPWWPQDDKRCLGCGLDYQRRYFQPLVSQSIMRRQGTLGLAQCHSIMLAELRRRRPASRNEGPAISSKDWPVMVVIFPLCSPTGVRRHLTLPVGGASRQRGRARGIPQRVSRRRVAPVDTSWRRRTSLWPVGTDQAATRSAGPAVPSKTPGAWQRCPLRRSRRPRSAWTATRSCLPRLLACERAAQTACCRTAATATRSGLSSMKLRVSRAYHAAKLQRAASSATSGSTGNDEAAGGGKAAKTSRRQRAATAASSGSSGGDEAAGGSEAAGCRGQ